MVTLTEFLLARIADDEAVAVKCQKLDAGVGSLSTWVEIGSDEVDAAVALGDRFSPTRVLAECQAKRQIVQWIEENDPDGVIDMSVAERYERDVLQLLALPYADHPDYDVSWRP